MGVYWDHHVHGHTPEVIVLNPQSRPTISSSPTDSSPIDALAMRANKHYSIREIYTITRKAARSIPALRRLEESRGKHFAERIMLAVTEVNGCALCAHAHTKFALDAGMEADEVRQLLGGITDGAPDDELAAIAFAQHYADTRAHPEREAWERLVEIHGEREALGVLGATRVMMWGNAFGIPLSSLRARRAGTPHPDSSLRYEIGTIAGAVLVSPFALLHAAASTVRRTPLI